MAPDRIALWRSCFAQRRPMASRSCSSRSSTPRSSREHAAVADLELIDRAIRDPDERQPDPRPGRERFFRREADISVLAVVEFGQQPAIIVTVFSTDQPPS